MPGPIPVSRLWITLPILTGRSYYNHCTVWFGHILTSIRSNVLQHFPSNNAVIAAVKQLVTGKQLVTAAGADFYERRMQAFVITGENTQLMVM